MWTAAFLGTEGLDADLACLDDRERARAAAFRFDRDGVRFVKSHAFTRRVLAGYLGDDPAALQIAVSPLGKPFLDPALGVSFSVSHAADTTGVAVTGGVEVGLDLEPVRPIADADELAEWYFTQQEAEIVRDAPPETRSQAFLELWTRKEAVVKALGRGLALPLDAFQVLAAQPIWLQPSCPEPFLAGLHLASGGAPDGDVGAVAAARGPITVRWFDARSP